MGSSLKAEGKVMTSALIKEDMNQEKKVEGLVQPQGRVHESF